MKFKEGDKVRFISKSKNMSLEELNKYLGINVKKECYGYIYRILEGVISCNIFNKRTHRQYIVDYEYFSFSKRDLIPFETIDYDKLTEIEE